MKYTTCLKKRNRYLFFNLNILIVIILSKILHSCKLKPPKIDDLTLPDSLELNTTVLETTPLIVNQFADKSNPIIRERLNKKSFDIEDLKQKLNDNFASNKIKLNNLKQKQSDYAKKSFASLFKKFNYNNEDLLNKIYASSFTKSQCDYYLSRFSKNLNDDKKNLDPELLASLKKHVEESLEVPYMKYMQLALDHSLPLHPKNSATDILNNHEYDYDKNRFKDGISLEKAKDNYNKLIEFIYKIQVDTVRCRGSQELVNPVYALLNNYSNNINTPNLQCYIDSNGKDSGLEYFISKINEGKSSIDIININKNHFIAVAAIRHPDDSVTILCKDSLSNGGDNHTLAKAFKNLKLKKVKIIFNKHTESYQKNFIDCSIFAITNAAILMEDISNCTKDNINQYIESFSEISYFCTQDYVKELTKYYFTNFVEYVDMIGTLMNIGE